MNLPLSATRGTAAAQNTLMYDEAAESAAVVKAQFAANSDQFKRIGKFLRANPPVNVVTCARGSSDHAAVYAKYLIETYTGHITSPAGLSVSSVYKAELKAQRSVCIAISQSGASPDLLASVAALKEGGAFIIALVNVEDSPLSRLADEYVPLCAGAERSVAATKSYIGSLTAIASLVAEWSDNDELRQAVKELPALLETAWELDWSHALPTLAGAHSLFILARGMGYGIAREAALKLKETSQIHAEAYSAAEVLHGPAALVKGGFPVLAFVQDDALKSNSEGILANLAARGAHIFAAGSASSSYTSLPTVPAHPAVEPILAIQSFYKLANSLAVLRGRDPDRPPHLSKVTETL